MEDVKKLMDRRNPKNVVCVFVGTKAEAVSFRKKNYKIEEVPLITIEKADEKDKAEPIPSPAKVEAGKSLGGNAKTFEDNAKMPEVKKEVTKEVEEETDLELNTDLEIDEKSREGIKELQDQGKLRAIEKIKHSLSIDLEGTTIEGVTLKIATEEKNIELFITPSELFVLIKLAKALSELA